MRKVKISIIEPAGAPDRVALAKNIQDLEQRAFHVRHTPTSPESGWTYASGPAQHRCAALSDALGDKDSDYVIAARGGYGASDLLPLLDWDQLAAMHPKCLIGLSDITALQVALYARLGWRGLHAVMPGGSLWHPGTWHTEHLLDLLGRGLPWHESLAVEPVGTKATERPVEGVLLGGCLAVLTSLIGTPYLPVSWKGIILFIEDTNENPGRLMRYWNQWQQCGVLNGLHAVLVGQLTGISERADVLAQFARRSPCPVYSCELFGHQTPSFAIGQGAHARIAGDKLHWEIDQLRTPPARSSG